MKSTINEQNTKTKSEYPCLKQIEIDGKLNVVLFLSKDTGICIYTEYQHYRLFEGLLGNKKEHWCESQFTPFNGTVTLSND